MPEIGRCPEGLARISRASGVHVVMGCGWYRDFGYPAVVQERTSSELAEILVAEIERGIGETGIRAGFIGEIGTGRHHISPAEERVFRAAALAQARTGVAIAPTRPGGARWRSNRSSCSKSAAPTWARSSSATSATAAG